MPVELKYATGGSRSKYEDKIRAILSQYRSFDHCDSLQVLAYIFRQDVSMIPRSNTAVAGVNYSAEIVDQFTPTERLEIWRRAEKETLIATITLKKP